MLLRDQLYTSTSLWSLCQQSYTRLLGLEQMCDVVVAMNNARGPLYLPVRGLPH